MKKLSPPAAMNSYVGLRLLIVVGLLNFIYHVFVDSLVTLFSSQISFFISSCQGWHFASKDEACFDISFILLLFFRQASTSFSDSNI